MTDTQHTPGPWAVVGGSIMVEYGGGFFDLAYVDGISPNGYLTIEERNANANLIAAAPEMLAALESSANLLCGFICKHRLGDPIKHADQCVANYAAIAKAKGETS